MVDLMFESWEGSWSILMTDTVISLNLSNLGGLAFVYCLPYDPCEGWLIPMSSVPSFLIDLMLWEDLLS